MNGVQLTGNLTRDPELRSTTSGKSVANLRIAVNWRDRDCDPVYIDITAWNALAETCGQYLTKGRHIAISGRLDQQEWTTDDGAKRSRHFIVATGERPGGLSQEVLLPTAFLVAAPACGRRVLRGSVTADLPSLGGLVGLECRHGHRLRHRRRGHCPGPGAEPQALR